MNTSFNGHYFTAKYSGISRVLKSKVFVESAILKNNKEEIEALWDTGASCSMIRPEVVKNLNLIPISKTTIGTPSGKDIPSNVYLINLYLPNKVVIENVRVVEGIPNNCQMLIGMDVINCGDFVVTNYNGTVFSFRMPSMEGMDFVNHS